MNSNNHDVASILPFVYAEVLFVAGALRRIAIRNILAQMFGMTAYTIEWWWLVTMAILLFGLRAVLPVHCGL